MCASDLPSRRSWPITRLALSDDSAIIRAMKETTRSSNTVWHHATVTRQRRERQNGHRGVILWFTGLSGSGKSTLAHAVEEELHRQGCRTFVCDGDNIRHGLCGSGGDFSQIESCVMVAIKNICAAGAKKWPKNIVRRWSSLYIPPIIRALGWNSDPRPCLMYLPLVTNSLVGACPSGRASLDLRYPPPPPPPPPPILKNVLGGVLGRLPAGWLVELSTGLRYACCCSFPVMSVRSRTGYQSVQVHCASEKGMRVSTRYN